jgi:hypothetical protein
VNEELDRMNSMKANLISICCICVNPFLNLALSISRIINIEMNKEKKQK